MYVFLTNILVTENRAGIVFNYNKAKDRQRLNLVFLRIQYYLIETNRLDSLGQIINYDDDCYINQTVYL